VSLPLPEVEAALEKKMPGHTFRAVMNLANAKEPEAREAHIREALDYRERCEALDASTTKE
jgi:hypothetical protein